MITKNQFVSCCLCYLLLLSLSAKAQSDAVPNHRWLNSFTVNPAAIENSEFLNINLTTRNQWVQFDGAPTSQFLSASLFLENWNSGLGMVAVNDKIGYTSTQTFHLAYAYQLQFADNFAWSLGLSGGILNRSIDRSAIDMMSDMLDPEISALPANRMTPDINFGTEFIHPRFKFGASLTHLSAIWEKEKVYTNTINKYAYFTFNSKFNDQLTFSPGLSFINRNNISVFEANALFYWKTSDGRRARDLFWVGASYKFSVKEAVGLLGINVSDNVSLGYCYDTNMGAIGKNSNATHELFLHVRIAMYSKEKPCPAYAAAAYWESRNRRR